MVWRIRTIVAFAVIGLGSGTFAQDASTHTTKPTGARVKMKAVLTSGAPVTIVALDGELSSVRVGEKKLGISATLLAPDSDALEVRFWQLTVGRNGAESIRALERAETRPGRTVVPVKATALGVVRSLEVLSVIPAPPAKTEPNPQGGTADRP